MIGVGLVEIIFFIVVPTCLLVARRFLKPYLNNTKYGILIRVLDVFIVLLFIPLLLMCLLVLFSATTLFN